MDKYLQKHYSDEITELLNETNDRSFVSLQVDLSKLQQENFDWFQAILHDAQNQLPKWDAALFAAQKTIAAERDGFLEPGYQIKINCHVRFVHLPPGDQRFKIPFPNFDQIGQFREVTGNVVRMTQTKLLELKREFICAKCKEIIVVEANYALMYRFEIPHQCSNYSCKGAVHQKSNEPVPKYCVNYQEIKIQEVLSDKNIPPTLIVTLDNDLVDSCQPGDCVTICGTIERRWTSFQSDGPRPTAIVTMRAISLTKEQNHLTVNIKHLSEQMFLMQLDWADQLEKFSELGLRDLILDSICPDIYGMYPVKLAIALAICSGNIDEVDGKNSDRLHQRGQSHVLLIGDPGLAKSKLLLSAVSIAPRAVHTTGMGCSSAGLTAAAVKEAGEWQLEAGALVLADGGICCIDEFNLMRETDRASIHEAMEQQTISMAKAGIVCKLNTRCAIIAAANPKNLYSMSEPEGASSINIGIASPLLSRFDLVFILRDERNPQWDSDVCDHLLAQVCSDFQQITMEKNANLWSAQKLQTHFATICNVHPKMTTEASEIISTYYRRCRSDMQRDTSRTTVRLLDSLHRLAEAHARLVFRSCVTAVDAVVVIRLMESTFGFGRVVQPYDVIKQELPLGPTNDEINEVLKVLQLGKYNSDTISEGSSSETALQPIEKASTEGKTIEYKSSQPKTQSPKPLTQIQSQPRNNSPKPSSQNQSQPRSNSPPQDEDDLDELSQILSLDDIEPVVDSTSKATKDMPIIVNNIDDEDEDDAILSQALDDLEQLPRSPLPKIRKIETNPPTNRLRIGFRSFKFRQPKKPVEQTITSTSADVVPLTDRSNTSVRNRIFCTPSDDECSQTRGQENVIGSNQGIQMIGCRSNQADAFAKPTSQKDSDDSAYDTMMLESPASAFIKKKTQNTPKAIESDDDLSCLDSIEFDL